MDDQPRENRAEEDATGVSSDLQRLFEASSFGSPEAQEAYAEPPPQLVAEIVTRVRSVNAIDGDCNETNFVLDGEHPREAFGQLLEAHSQATLPTNPDEGLDIPAAPPVRQVSNVATNGHGFSRLVYDLTVLANRDAMQQRHAPIKPLVPSMLTGSWLLPHGSDNPREVDQVEDIDKARFGQDAFDLAQEYLAAGRFDRTRHWLTVAAKYDIQQAETLLADIAAIQDALGNPQGIEVTTGTSLNRDAVTDQKRRVEFVNEIHEAGALLRRAREQADVIVSKAESAAEEIVSEARIEAAAYAATEELLVPGNRVKDEPGNDWFRLLPHLEFKHDARATRPWRDHRENLAQRLIVTYSLDQEKTRTAWSRWSRRLIKLGDADQVGPHSLPRFDASCVETRDRMSVAIETLSAAVLALDRSGDVAQAANASLYCEFDTDKCRTAAMRMLGILKRWTVESSLSGTDYWSVVPDRGLWTPAREDEARGPKPDTEQRLKREKIVVGPKFRRALEEFTGQIAVSDV